MKGRAERKHIALAGRKNGVLCHCHIRNSSSIDFRARALPSSYKVTHSYKNLLLAVALKRLDDLEGAERVLRKAHAFAPQDPLVLINYAIVLDALGKAGSAVEFLTALNDITAVIDVDAQASGRESKAPSSYSPLPSPPAGNADGEETVGEAPASEGVR